MSSKKYNRSGGRNAHEKGAYTSQHSPVKVWAVRIVVVLLCIAVAITLIPSVFF